MKYSIIVLTALILGVNSIGYGQADATNIVYDTIYYKQGIQEIEYKDKKISAKFTFVFEQDSLIASWSIKNISRRSIGILFAENSSHVSFNGEDYGCIIFGEPDNLFHHESSNVHRLRKDSTLGITHIAIKKCPTSEFLITFFTNYKSLVKQIIKQPHTSYKKRTRSMQKKIGIVHTDGIKNCQQRLFFENISADTVKYPYIRLKVSKW